MSVLIPNESRATASRAQPLPPLTLQSNAWRLLGWLGLAYFIMAIIDLALGWYPVRFGTPEWEFGTVSATIQGMAIPTLSLYLMMCSALVTGRRGFARGLSILLLILALFLAGLFVLYLTSVPLALKAVAVNPIIHTGMKKAIVKAVMLFIGYEGLFLLSAWYGWKRVEV